MNFDAASDRLADGMIDFLNAVNTSRPGTWKQAEITWHLDHRPPIRIRVGRTSWQGALGGTMILYFLLAYHYSLISLDIASGHYPGLAILDFPATFHGVDVTSEESFLLQPFMKLIERQATNGAKQLIAAGSLFDGLTANRILLTKVWVNDAS